MPKRTNDFQKLVKLVQKALVPAGATVEESAMVENQGTPREIDVLIQDKIGPYKMKIALEVKDHARPLGPQIVEEYIGKYRQGDGIPVNQVVIVSSNGFTRGAREKARVANIRLLTLREAKTADWSKFIPPHTAQKLRFRLPPHYHRILFFPPLSPETSEIIQFGRIICDCCGRDHGTVGEMLQNCVRRYLLGSPASIQKMRETQKEHNGHALATLNMTFTDRVILLHGREYPMHRVAVEVHFCEAEADMQVKTYEQSDAEGEVVIVQHAKAEVLGKSIEMVLPDGLKSKQIVLDIRDADTSCPNTESHKPQQRAKARRAG